MSFLGLAQSGQAFNHPGLFNNGGDLNRDKAGINAGTEPWRSAWERLTNSWIPGVNGTYTPSPLATVTDNGSRSQAICNDSTAAYVNAIEWYMTGKPVYANTAINILNAWSSTCTNIDGSNAQLAAGIDFINMVNAAEIIRYSNAGWSQANINTFSNFLQNVVYPPCAASGWDSWGGVANAMMMMIGVFNNNQTIYNQGYNNFTGTNPALACFAQGLYDTNSISFGQSADSWRDQGHAQLGVNIGLGAAEVALNSSGQNLFTFHNNLLLSACEYAAKYNLGHGVTWDDTFGTTPICISSQTRGKFSPNYAMAHSGFQRSGLSDPYTTQVLKAEGIECIATQGGGLGTLLYTQGSTARPVPQYALVNNNAGYVMAGNGGTAALTATSPCIRNLETFKEIVLGNGYSSLVSTANGNYVTANGTMSLIANSTTVETAQEFKVIDMGDEEICLVSAENGEMIAVNDGIFSANLVYNSGFYNALTVYSVGTTVPAVITNLNGSTYAIANVNSSYWAEVSGASMANGAVVDQWVDNGGNNQIWTFSNAGNGFYYIKNVNSGLVLDVANASTSEGALIDQWQSTGNLNQLWVPQFVNYADGTGSYNLYSANAPINLNLLEVPGNSTAQGTQLDQWAPNGGANQQWSIP